MKLARELVVSASGLTAVVDRLVSKGLMRKMRTGTAGENRG
jgi:DNA-binding MarR family transcriptional regulator